jgi:hypothetical protein
MIRSLPLSDWPEADRDAWIRACQPSRRLTRGGLAAHMKPITRTDLERRNGYFLEFLGQTGQLDRHAEAAAQVSPSNVEAFIQRVLPGWSSITLSQSVYKLRRISEIMSPSTDFRWLSDIENKLAAVAYPKDRFDKIVTTETLVEAGLTLVRQAQIATRRRPLWRALMMRDCVMVAMLAHHPIRLKNFAALELGKSFVRIRDDWWILLTRNDTKSKRPDERIADETLREAIALYLTWARPRLLRASDDPLVGTTNFGCPRNQDTRRPEASVTLHSGPFWISQYGQPLDYGSVALRIVETTHATMGVPISPHDFRRCAAVRARFRAGSKPISRAACCII